MADVAGKWGDLGPRVTSAAVLLIIGGGAVWLGGAVFLYVAAIAAGLIGWEIARICNPGGGPMPIATGIVAGATILFSGYAPDWVLVVLLVGVPVIAAAAIAPGGDRVRMFNYLAWVLIATWGLVELRGLGMVPVIWLAALVVACDVAGYFVGRTVGGPKFWPRISPKKTWSGTVGGWIAAGLVGLVFAPHLGTGVIWLSVLVALASQMGDIAASALKRSKGVKDFSALIPGHGGVFDRFDALMGAALVVTLARLLGLIGG
jgi:phosphatidate cytidylyltransferase